MRTELRATARRLGIVLTLALLGALLPTVASAGGDGLQRATEAKERVAAQLLGKPGIVGAGVALNGGGQPSVRVYTAARQDRVPASVDGVAVEQVVTGLIVARACQDTGDPRQRCNRPVPIGVSVGHPSITAGTIGARVKNGSGAVFALSNNHVLAASNAASIGDGAIQPGTADGGSDPTDRIGTLAAFRTISFNRLGCTGGASDPDCNTIDAAIASTTTSNLGTSTLPGGYGTPSANTSSPSVGLSVTKCGRTTGCTTGTVAEVNVTVDVCYVPQGPFCATNGAARFVNQIGISDGSFSAGGDSGSLIVTTSGRNPVGLLFAGGSTRTFANEIGRVLSNFNVSIDTDGSTPPPVSAPSGLTATLRTQGQTRVDLAWSGGAASVSVQRTAANGSTFSTLATVSNTGSYRDNLGRSAASGTYTYRVCNAGTTTCSNDASVTK